MPTARLCVIATLVFAASTSWHQRSMASALPGAGAGGSLPAYLPELRVQGVGASTPARAPAGGTFQLTPAGCTGAACTGFRVSNAPDFPASRTNSASFAPSATTTLVDPWNNQTVELATVQLVNGGFMVPADGGAGTVPMSLSLQIATKGSGRSTAVTLPFLVQWSPGSPAAPNNAGLFVLVTRQSGTTPAPTQQFTVAMTSGIEFNFKLELVGFQPAASEAAGAAASSGGAAVTVLGDWGQPAPAAGQPGPRVAVKQGAGTQTVTLVGRISRVLDGPVPGG